MVSPVYPGAGLASIQAHLAPRDIYFLDHIPFPIESGDLLAVLGAAVALVVTSTFDAGRRRCGRRRLCALERIRSCRNSVREPLQM